MKKIPYIARFDSAAAMLSATANFLHGKDFSGLGIAPMALLPIAELMNLLPVKLREQIYQWSGWLEAISIEKLASLSFEEITSKVVEQYPAIAIGSSNGALVHLYCSLNIPGLPQTYFIPVRRSGIHPDDPQTEMEWGKHHAVKFLAARPDLQLHHMHDPNQDRLMIQQMTYFRIKKLKLGEPYERFIKQALPEGGIIFVVDCQVKWEVTKVAERHYFQFGGLGEATMKEYLEGSQRVKQYLYRYQSPYSSWKPPVPNSLIPEAEWSFEKALYMKR